MNPSTKVKVPFVDLKAQHQSVRSELLQALTEVVDTAYFVGGPKLQRFEEELGDQEYLLGEFSLVDADLLPRFTRLEGFGVLPDSSLPRLGKYLARVKARPSVKAIL
jgi:glutathione S-transferase